MAQFAQTPPAGQPAQTPALLTAGVHSGGLPTTAVPPATAPANSRDQAPAAGGQVLRMAQLQAAMAQGNHSQDLRAALPTSRTPAWTCSSPRPARSARNCGPARSTSAGSCRWSPRAS
jgi:hypothetical protein